MQAVMISAPHKSSGKTMLALGLARALHRMGLRVQMFKKGPDYIDPIWHTLASGQPSYNLDFNTQSREEITQLFRRKSQQADVVLVEGNHGLFDGQDIDGSDSNAALANLLDIPVTLVVDVTGFTRGLAPLLQGYASFGSNICFNGVILNKHAGTRHKQRLQEICRRFSPMPLLGLLSRWKSAPVQERHLGLQPANENAAAEGIIDTFADRMQEEMDVSNWLSSIPNYKLEPPIAEPLRDPLGTGLKVGFFQDEAFGFYYADDLERFRAQGVEMVAINALRDPGLPELDGLFIGGGFPEMKAEQLSRNDALRQSVQQALVAGLPCYAECGGLMYLAKSISYEGRQWPMVGFLPAAVNMQARPVGRGLMKLRVADHPWHWKNNTVIAAHEFHHSAWHAEGATELPCCWQVERGHGIDGHQDGVIQGNTIAGYAHLRHTEACPWVDQFIQFIREKKT